MLMGLMFCDNGYILRANSDTVFTPQDRSDTPSYPRRRLAAKGINATTRINWKLESIGTFRMVFLHQYLSLALPLVAFASLADAKGMPYLRQADLSKINPTNGDWMSISENVEFMPNTNLPPLPKGRKNRKLDEDEEESTTGAYEAYDPYSVQPFVEGMSEYDEYQQAWRLLGFMIDCNSADDDDGGSGSGSGDQGTEDGCARYVLWAAVSNIYKQYLIEVIA